MSEQSLFVFPTIESLIERRNNDPEFAERLTGFISAEFSDDEVRAAIAAAYTDVNKPVLRELALCLDGPLAIGGYTIPSVGLQALMVAVFCVGNDLVVRYRIGSGGFLDLTRTPESVTCMLEEEPAPDPENEG